MNRRNFLRTAVAIAITPVVAKVEPALPRGEIKKFHPMTLFDQIEDTDYSSPPIKGLTFAFQIDAVDKYQDDLNDLVWHDGCGPGVCRCGKAHAAGWYPNPVVVASEAAASEMARSIDKEILSDLIRHS